MKLMKLTIILVILICVWTICSIISDNQCIVDNKEHLANTTNNIICNEAIQNIASILNTGNGSVNNLTIVDTLKGNILTANKLTTDALTANTLTANTLTAKNINNSKLTNAILSEFTTSEGSLILNRSNGMNPSTPSLTIGPKNDRTLRPGEANISGINFLYNAESDGMYSPIVQQGENIIFTNKNLNIVPHIVGDIIGGGIKIKSDGDVLVPRKVIHGGLNGIVKRMPNARSVDEHNIAFYGTDRFNYSGFETTADECINKCRIIPTASASTFNKADKKCWCKTIQALRGDGGHNDAGWETTYFN